jgi:hypothetical protein
MNRRISIRELQTMSTEKIEALDGGTPIKSGERTIAILTPIKRANLKRLTKTLLETERLAKKRDRAADDAALRALGIAVDKTDWSFAAMRQARRKAKRSK